MTPHPTSDLDIQQLLGLLRRRAKMIIATGLAGAILAGLIGWIVPPRYTGKAQLVINSGSQNASGLAGANAFNQASDDVAIETHVAMLTSQKHLQQVLDSFQAESASPDTPPAEPGSGSLLQRFLNIRLFETETEKGETPTTMPEPSAPVRPALDIEVLERGLNVFRERRSRVIGVSFTSEDPAFAAEVANRTVKLYLEDQLERERAWTQRELEKISERLPHVRSEAEKATAAAQLYQIEHGLVADGKEDSIDPTLAELSRQLNLAKSDLAERQERIHRLQNLRLSDSEFPASLEALRDPELSELYEGESARHRTSVTASASLSAQVPEQGDGLQQKMKTEIAKKLSLYEDEARVLAARVNSLQQSVATLQKTNSEAREHGVRLRELLLEAKLANQLYEKLLSRHRELRDRWDTQSEVRILAFSPVPDEPSSPHPALFILPALVLSLLPASLIAILLEKSDQSLRSEQEVNTALAVPCVGVVPKLKRTQLTKPYLQLVQTPRSPYAVSIRSIVASTLQLMGPKASSKTILVTSSVANEGASSLALSFAFYAAQLQRRVLLIGVNSPHLLSGELLEDSAGTDAVRTSNTGLPAESIRHAPDLNIDYLSLAGSLSDPAALLLDGRLSDLLHQLKETYDCVIIESAPVLGATETQLLVPHVDRVILAIKWGSTPRVVVQNALAVLRKAVGPSALQNDAIGAVITQVDLKRHARYRFGDSAEMLFRFRSRRSGSVANVA